MSKKLKKLRKKINKVLGEFLRDPDTTYGMAERICYNLHQDIEETYRNSFTKTGKLYVEKRIVSPRQPYEPLENGEIMSQDIKNNRQDSILTVRKEKQKDICIDDAVPYEPWKKEDIEKTFSRMQD